MYRLTLIVGLVVAFAVPALAESGSGVGAGQTTSSTTFELPNGKILYTALDQFHDVGAGTPFDNTAIDCHASWIFEADYSAGKMHSLCTVLNPAGDVLMYLGVGDLSGGKWRILDGTGSFADVTGGGTWTMNAPLPNFDRWSFTWTWDSEWTGE